MKKSTFFIAGIALGVYLSKQIESNPEVKQTVKSVGNKVKVFANAVVDGYREQESKPIPKTRAKVK